MWIIAMPAWPLAITPGALVLLVAFLWTASQILRRPEAHWPLILFVALVLVGLLTAPMQAFMVPGSCDYWWLWILWC